MESVPVSEQVMRQYEILVNSSIQVTIWRQSANNFYLSVNTALLALAAYLYSFSSATGIVIGVIGLATTALWHETIQYYRSLNKAKFSVIAELEKQLPVPMFQLEDERFVKEDRKKATWIESKISILFGIAYILIIIVHIYRIITP
ncbi:MAG: hypothetical protein ABSB80_11080 [Methanoregula sp.]|jgi:hypothetical protein|uniref:RipA family octameric membrane protein n=1 Tax=Methanoregula sp. TaxID=2052170 RepID=UPI003D0D214F